MSLLKLKKIKISSGVMPLVTSLPETTTRPHHSNLRKATMNQMEFWDKVKVVVAVAATPVN